MTYIPKALRPPVKRSDLEYPTEDVNLTYLLAISKADWWNEEEGARSGLVTVDSFTDKAGQMPCADYGGIAGRFQDAGNYYGVKIATPVSTNDFVMFKFSGGNLGTMGSEAVDLDNKWYRVMLSITGSTLKGFRTDMTTPKISATDTTFASGKYGTYQDGGRGLYSSCMWDACKLLAPATPLPPAQSIVEVEVVGSGSPEDQIRPNFAQLLDKHPEFGDIDKYAVTWGAFDYKGESTMLVVVTGDNPYQSGAILKQIEHAKSKNLKVYKPPRDLTEVKQLHRQIKQDRPEIIAGVHDLAYQCIGHEKLEHLAVADFYDGFTQGIYDTKNLKNIPDWELRKTIAMWKDRLKRVTTITATEVDKHMKKLEEFERVGW